MRNNVFKVFDGGPGGEHTATYIDASAAAEAEGGGGDGGDGDVPPIWKLDVRRDVQWMKAGWAVLIPALITFLFFFFSEMTDVRKEISGVDSKVSAQSAKIDDMAQSLDRIEMRLDSRPNNQEVQKAGHGKPNG